MPCPESPQNTSIRSESHVTPVSRMRWAYGLTTVPQRKDELLPATLRSLAAAGFDRPKLFVDGCEDDRGGHYRWYRDHFPQLEIIPRYGTLRTHGNWVLSLYELFIKDPSAERYALFQDDLITYRNLRVYLEQCLYPENGYWNLYTFPSNQRLAPRIGQTARFKTGWYEAAMLDGRESDGQGFQMGRGAVALVFSRQAVLTLLASPHMVERPMDCHRGHRSVDGGIVTAMNKAGWREWVHNPSLVQHAGLVSSMRNRQHPLAESFRGEEFDALGLLKIDAEEKT